MKEQLHSLKELANATKAEFQNQLITFETHAVEAKKIESELINRNKLLEEELEGMRSKWNESESIGLQQLSGEVGTFDTNTEASQCSQVRF